MTAVRGAVRSEIAGTPTASTTVLVRLPNYVGDALMAWPALADPTGTGWRPHLLGRPWACDLFAATGLSITPYPRDLRGRVRALRSAARAADTRTIVLLTHSFSSAAEARMAGLRPIGYRKDARGWLLHRSPGHLPPGHLTEAYRRLVAASAAHPPTTATPPLPITEQARSEAARLCLRHQLASGFVLLCPQAGGRHRGHSKDWPDFAALADILHRQGWPTVATPGPGETEAFRVALPDSLLLPDLNLQQVAALAERCRLAIANDSGLGHLAAAVGAPLLSLFGRTDPGRVRPWSDRARVLGGRYDWPSLEEVRATAEQILSEQRPPRPASTVEPRKPWAAPPP